eukprot:TRINITY_DN6273_c0_g1_i2.p1 TRINITY_DN6273_c0_g1~~TRINITY_DN6273_c0_g1_i2.p1  ORF type:complete len:122 (+),score=33.95 TRINITY_DN6273_c0_g1_i2:139-504(+)
MALAGAEILFYPTAIGSELLDKSIDSSVHWQNVMTGHAAANIVPVVASNRIGVEKDLTFYGCSFISNHRGEVVAKKDRETEGVLTFSFDLAKVEEYRRGWGLFRDRRPELYSPLMSLTGRK